jgi:hypothetical protein
VPKHKVWNLPQMRDDELRSLISRCNQMERELKAPHKKARQGWTALRAEAEAELASRGRA